MATEAFKDFATEAGHWYDASGQPAYTIIGANGKERNTTLRDARKLGLFPSVSGILQLEAKPALTRWMVQQALMSALTLPRLPAESDDAFLDRALQDSKEQARKAASRGTYLHGLMEETMSAGGKMPLRASQDDYSILHPVLLRLKQTYGAYQWLPERSFASASGFGGKIDLHGVSGENAVVIDFKFKDFSDADKVLAYPEHCTQLAAYAYGLGGPIATCVNLFISSTVPGLFVVKEWTAAERDNGWQCFSCLLLLWKLRRGYLT
jgi:hypothetical protein